MHIYNRLVIVWKMGILVLVTRSQGRHVGVCPFYRIKSAMRISGVQIVFSLSSSVGCD